MAPDKTGKVILMTSTADLEMSDDVLKCLNAFVSKEARGYAKKHKLTGEVRVFFKNGNLRFLDLPNGNSWHWRTLTKKEERELR